MGLAENLEAIRNRIERACARAGRDPEEVALMAVTKGRAPSVVAEAAALGLTLFGENRVQEARIKIGQCPSRLHWQMIGHLQSNKCRDAVHFFEMIQSVDSLELAGELEKAAAKSGKRMPVLLEVNMAEEASKFGFEPGRLLEELPEINTLGRLEIHGLMTVAPWSAEAEKVRPVFRGLRELNQRCEEVLGAPMAQLSMGMSGDFEAAVEEGSTLIRIGTALFGPRGAKPPAAAPAQTSEKHQARHGFNL
jgi:pyridoxal phosphate enzyme (YggS family)